VATEKLNISGWDSGWPTGYVANVDESVASADGQAVSTSMDNDVVIFDLDASVIDDVDVVTDIGITVRAMFEDEPAPSNTGSLTVALLIGGVSQGSESTGDLTDSQANYVLSNAGWDSDWTAAQLAGMQVRVTSSTPSDDGDPIWSLDCIDVDITFTDNTSSLREPDEAALTLAGKVPVTTIPGQEHVLAGSAALAGQAPILALGVVTAKGSLVTAGQLSYVNPVTEQLQIDSWDSGWPTGYAANVDEPVTSADGQTVSTQLYGDVAFFSLDNVSATVNEDTILGVTMLVRAKFDYLGLIDFADADLSVSLVIDGAPLTARTISYIGNEGVFVNTTLTHPSWNQDWTVAQLNSMQIKVQAFAVDADETVPLFEALIDTIDVYVERSAQSPIISRPPAAELELSKYPSTLIPTLRMLKYERPLVGTVALLGYAPTLQRTAQALPSEARRFLVEQLPLRIVNHVTQPAVAALALTEQTPLRTVGNTELPAVRAQILAGKVPTLALTEDHYLSPAMLPLLLSGAAPLLEDNTFDPPRARRNFVGKVPVLVETDNIMPVPAAGAAALATYAPKIASRNTAKVPLVGAVTLASTAPGRYLGESVIVPSGSLALTALEPSAAFQFAEVDLLGYAPTLLMDHRAKPAVVALTFDEFIVEVENGSIFMYVGPLQFTGHVPTMGFSTSLSDVGPRLINLTVDRDIEFIATPTDILIE